MVNCKVLHIVFGKSVSESLKVCLKKLGIENEEKEVYFPDIFSVGPIWKLHHEVGLKQRIDWIRTQLSTENDYYEDKFEKDFNKTKEIVCNVSGDTTIFLWAGDNSHEQTGIRYVLYLLKEIRNNIILINTTKTYNEQFKSPNIVYSLVHTGELPPEKLMTIYKKKKSNKPISTEERKKLHKEWELLAETQDLLRIWKNDEIHCVYEGFYDSFIINKARILHEQQKSKVFIKSTILIAEVLCNLEQYVGDTFIKYRMKHLINNGTFGIENAPKVKKSYSIKLRS